MSIIGNFTHSLLKIKPEHCNPLRRMAFSASLRAKKVWRRTTGKSEPTQTRTNPPQTATGGRMSRRCKNIRPEPANRKARLPHARKQEKTQQNIRKPPTGVPQPPTGGGWRRSVSARPGPPGVRTRRAKRAGNGAGRGPASETSGRRSAARGETSPPLEK